MSIISQKQQQNYQKKENTYSQSSTSCVEF